MVTELELKSTLTNTFSSFPLNSKTYLDRIYISYSTQFGEISISRGHCLFTVRVFSSLTQGAAAPQRSTFSRIRTSQYLVKK